MMSTIISLACSAGCCLITVVFLVGALVLLMRMMSGGDEDFEPLAPAPAAKTPRKEPNLPPPNELKPAPEVSDDPFDEDEADMATVVGPPSALQADIPAAPPPPPPGGAAPKKPTPPPPPPRSSGQTIIAFDDDEDF